MEIWKDIIGYEGLYQVSSYGRIKSLPKKRTLRGRIYFTKEILRIPVLHKNGYLQITLYKDKVTIYSVHRLVALAFISNPHKKKEVNHLDGNKLNNDYKNLEWSTPSENSKHSYKIGLRSAPKGEHSPVAKLTNQQAADIRKLFDMGGYTKSQLSKIYFVDPNTINQIIKMKIYKIV